MNGSEEVASGLVIASGDGTKLLEFGQEVLDQVARFIEMPIELAGHPSVGPPPSQGQALGGITAVLPPATSGSMTRSSASNALSAINTVA